MQTRDWLFIVVLVYGLWHALAGALPIAPPSTIAPTTKATAAVYVYEKDASVIPSPVAFALNRLNREKQIRATTFEEDIVDGTGEVPEQYKAALAEARKAGLPCLVVLNGDAVVKVVKAPKTEADVLEAVP